MPFNPAQICLVAEATGNNDGWSVRTVQLDFGGPVPAANLEAHIGAIDLHLDRCSFGLTRSDMTHETNADTSVVYVTGQNRSEALRIAEILMALYHPVPLQAVG